MITLFHESDAALVRRTLGGDEKAFASLVRRYLQVAHAVAYAHTGNHADAEDITQDTFLKAFQTLNTLHDTARFGAWIVSIARNRAIDVVRKRVRHETLANNVAQLSDREEVDMEKRERVAALREQLLALEEGPREIIVLHYFAGKSVREIAVLLRITKAAAQKRLWRARELLTENLLAALRETEAELPARDERLRKVLGAIPFAAAPWKGAAAATGTATLLGVKQIVATVVVLLLAAGGVGFWKFQHKAAPSPDPILANLDTATSGNALLTARSATVAADESTKHAAQSSATGSAHMGIEGRAITELGKPLAKFLIMARRDVLSPDGAVIKKVGSAPAQIDDAGHFSISVTQADSYDLLVLAPGGNYYGEKPTLRVAVAEDQWVQGVTFIYDQSKASRVFGHVSSAEGKPVADAYVSTKGNGPIYDASTDGDGAFSFLRFEEGLFNLSVTSKDAGQAFLPGLEPRPEGFDIVLGGFGSVEGHVVAAESGAPIADFSVTFSSGPDPIDWDITRPNRQFHDPNGAYHLDNVPPGDVCVIARAPGRATAILRHIVVAANEIKDGVDLRLERGVRVTGTVVDASGKPVIDALLFEGEPPHLWQGDLEKLARWRSRSEGRFEMVDVSPGTTRISAYHRQHPVGGMATVDLKAATIEPVHLTLADAIGVKGTVRSSAGPIANAGVEIRYSEPPDAQGVAAMTDGQGNFEIKNAVAGSGELRIHETLGPGMLHEHFRWMPITIGPETSGAALDITLPVADGTVEGRVLYNETPPPNLGVEVNVTSADGARDSLCVPVAEDGSYRIDNVPQGQLEFRLRRLIDTNSYGMWPTTVVQNMVAGATAQQDFVYTGAEQDLTEGFWQALVAAYPDR